MKIYKIIAFTFILAAVLLIIILGAYAAFSSYEYAEFERKRDEAKEPEQTEAIQYTPEEIEKLQYEADQNYELKYDLMIKTIEENSDYYESFSKEFITEFEKYGYDSHYENSGTFKLRNVEDKMKIEFNSDLLGKECYIRNEIGIIYVDLDYPIAIDVYGFYSRYSIIYIPDEYMNDEVITKLNTEIHGSTLENIKENLFIAKLPNMDN
jgi:hypothetical protein